MLTVDQQATVTEALEILATYHNSNDVLNSPELVKQFCQLQIGALQYEVFGVIFLDTHLRMITFDKMFRGTVDGAAVYPREVARAAILNNANAVIVTHNHPSDNVKPSNADIQLTQNLGLAMELLDIRLLDHVVVGLTDTYSFAESGLL